MRNHRPLGRTAIALLAILVSAPLAAQQYGNIYGTVLDDQGGTLPGVTVTLEGVGAPRLAITNERGEYRFLNLDPGNYYLKAELQGFSTVEQPNVVVALNRNITINFTLSSAVEELITVTSESPLLDERHFAKGTVLSEIELETVPTAREPWAILNQTPGVLVTNVNVGGSESGQQPAFLGLGSHAWDNDYLIDGIQITDMTATGSSPTYYDFEQFESVEIATGGPDVTKNTGGVSINMVTRRGTNEFRGTARFLSVKDDGLGFLGGSSSDFDCSDLHADQDCETFTTNRIDTIDEYGFEAGGPAIPDRLWFWGSYGVQDIDLVAAGGDEDDTVIENTSIKVNAQISNANSAVTSWNNGDKTVFGRGASPTRSVETTWHQRGPSAFWRFEDTHIFGSSFFLTGSYQKSDLGFALRVRSGCEDSSCPPSQETLWDSDGVWRRNFQTGYARRPEEALKIDGSYFFNTGEITHELKFGGRVRESTGASNFIWPGRNVVHIAGENFGSDPGPVDFFFLFRSSQDLEIEIDYTSLWIQDTIQAGNWTVNLGARYDLQNGINYPGTTGPSAVPEWLPTITFDDPVPTPFDWETVSPRIGLTYAAGEERDTLLRASFSRFPMQMGTFEAAWINPAVGYLTYGAYAYFLFIDGPEDNNTWDGDEPYVFLFGAGYDPENPASNLNTLGRNFRPEITDELIIGVEHAFLPELVVSASYTVREIDDLLWWARWNVRSTEASGAGRPEVTADYVLDGSVSVELPDGSTSAVEIFALDEAFEYTGFTHYANDERSRRYNGLTLSLQKRLANRWSARGYVNWGETEWIVPRSFRETVDDPNPHMWGWDTDGATYLIRSNTKGRGERYMQSRWQANLTGLVQIALERPWGFTLAGNIYAREGSPLPYDYTTFDSRGHRRRVSLMEGKLERFRLDDLITVDLRAEKEFSATGDVSLTFGVDLFNALNEATPLSRELTLSGSTGDYLLDIVSPRVWKLSVRVGWR